MKKLIYAFCFLLSCSQSEKLFIKTTTATEKDGVKNSSEAISEITSEYFEVSLNSRSDNTYEADKTLEEPTSPDNYRYVFFVICKEDGSEKLFKDSAEFLNFMSGCGYEMVNQVKNKYGGDYTFKRK